MIQKEQKFNPSAQPWKDGSAAKKIRKTQKMAGNLSRPTVY